MSNPSARKEKQISDSKPKCTCACPLYRYQSIYHTDRTCPLYPALDRLSDEYGTLVAACNYIGTEVMWLAVCKRFQEIADEGYTLGCSFDANPTLRWKV